MEWILLLFSAYLIYCGKSNSKKTKNYARHYMNIARKRTEFVYKMNKRKRMNRYGEGMLSRNRSKMKNDLVFEICLFNFLSNSFCLLYFSVIYGTHFFWMISYLYLCLPVHLFRYFPFLFLILLFGYFIYCVRLFPLFHISCIFDSIIIFKKKIRARNEKKYVFNFPEN